jgi:hypothetical protein
MQQHLQQHRRFYQTPIFWLGCLAAAAYSSWPLGFILNPRVSEHDLASMLEAPHQPYNWLFVAADVLTSVIISIMAAKQLSKRHANWKHVAAICSYWFFGLLVGIAAITPLNCNPEAGQCGPLINQPYILIHGFASIGSTFALFISLAILGAITLGRPKNQKIQVAYSILLASWVLFGVGSLLELVLHIKGNTLQYFFISLCSLTIIQVSTVLESHHGALKTGHDSNPPLAHASTLQNR